MGFLRAFFGFKGRLNRAEYAIVFAGYLLLLTVFFLTENSRHSIGYAGDLFGFALIISSLWILFASMAKRFHDIDKTAWACLLIFIPVVGPLTPFVLLFYRGSETNNDYGEPQKFFRVTHQVRSMMGELYG
jgi:uncharacterized membrane protein YhaH (DUF805 family)